jgi:hypothetical protein
VPSAVTKKATSVPTLADWFWGGVLIEGGRFTTRNAGALVRAPATFVMTTV